MSTREGVTRVRSGRVWSFLRYSCLFGRPFRALQTVPYKTGGIYFCSEPPPYRSKLMHITIPQQHWAVLERKKSTREEDCFATLLFAARENPSGWWYGFRCTPSALTDPLAGFRLRPYNDVFPLRGQSATTRGGSERLGSFASMFNAN